MLERPTTGGPNGRWWPDAKIGISQAVIKAGTLVEITWEGANGFIQMVEPDGSMGFFRVGYGAGNMLVKFYSVGTYTFHLMGDTKNRARMASVTLKVKRNTFLLAQPITNNTDLHETPKTWRRRKRPMGRPRTSPLPLRFVGWVPTPSGRTHRVVVPDAPGTKSRS